MPKMKSHKSALKRFRVTGSGKIVRKQSGRSHLNSKHSSKSKRKLDAKVVVDPSNLKKLVFEIPYAKYAR